MCAKYGSATEYNMFERAYKISFAQIITLPQKIIFPHTIAPVILQKNNAPELELMNYSLIPSWSKARKPKFATYNARIEEVRSKPSWKEPFKSKHCIVPVMNFYESVYDGPYAGHNISLFAKAKHLLSAAGIWDSWLDQASGEEVHSFAILTTEPPQDVLDAGHDRCPIFLPTEKAFEWIQDNRKADDWVEFLANTREVVEFGVE
jgi:Uncharacterized conserved protein